jgi:CHAT domain-containing protein
MTRGDDMADEVVALPTGFLYAGSQAVVSTLWRVFDISASLLMGKFHEFYRQGEAVGSALRQAQNWLRTIPSGRYLKETLLAPLIPKLDYSIRNKVIEQANHFARAFPDSPPFASEDHWAAFIASGLTWKG